MLTTTGRQERMAKPQAKPTCQKRVFEPFTIPDFCSIGLHYAKVNLIQMNAPKVIFFSTHELDHFHVLWL